MFSKGQVIYFTPFHFKNGSPSKNKYFIVLKNIGPNVIVASLPTSINHVPNFLRLSHGCINDDENRVNCYLFEKERIICDNGFSFQLRTFIHGNEVDDYEIQKLVQEYTLENVDYQIVGTLLNDELKALIKCILESKSVKRKIIKWLQ